MSKFVLFDTTLLIAHYNDGRFTEPIQEVLSDRILRFSAIALYELGRGAHDRTSLKIYRDLLKLAEGKIVTPSESNWRVATDISQRLLRSKRYDKIGVSLLQNDILIALSARTTGGTLVTLDRDFEVLQSLMTFNLILWR